VLLLALGHLPAVTLRAAPGFALPGITPAHPHRLLNQQPPSVRGIHTADLAFGDVSAIGQSLRLHEHDSAHFAGEIHRTGRQAVAEVLIVLPRAGLVYKLRRD
jgi:hypothetical protein